MAITDAPSAAGAATEAECGSDKGVRSFHSVALAQFPELRRLPKRQKMKFGDELWRDAVDDRVPVSFEDRVLLDSRWKAYRAGKTARISLQELER